MAAQHRARNDDIEALRAVAVLFTLACHINTLLAWKGPAGEMLQHWGFWGGVDLFFCISGYVITGTLLHQQRGNSFSDFALPFYVRRIFRIWPAALLWLIVPLLAARYFNQSGVFGNLSSDVPASVAAALQIENVYAAVCGHGSTTPCGQADVYWSLSLEEQFYILFPLLLYLMRRSRLKRVLLGVAVLQLFLIRPYEGLIWSLRTDAICLGVLMALLQSEGRLQLKIRTARERIAYGVIAVGLLALIAIISVTPALRFNAGMLALVSAALLLIASADADLILPWPGVRPLLMWTGSRSFAIYLVHNPCFRATRELFARLDLLPSNGGFSWLMLVSALLLIATVAEVTYRVVEMPLRMWGRQLARRWPAAPPSPSTAQLGGDPDDHAANPALKSAGGSVSLRALKSLNSG